MRVSFSPGNIKMGAIMSVSQPPIKTCPHNCPCFKDCYAERMCRYRPNVKAAYENNYAVYSEHPTFYMNAVREAAKTQRFFRWHVGGDIVDKAYFAYMVDIAKELRYTQFLCFTKQYDIVNDYIAEHGELPPNLHMIMSAWEGKTLENPFSIPVCRVIEKDETPDDSWILCGGNCTECAVSDGGCWSLQNGSTIAIYKH